MQISYCNVPDAKTVFGKSYQNVSWNSLRSVDIWKLVFLKIVPKKQIAYFQWNPLQPPTPFSIITSHISGELKGMAHL